MKKTAFIFITFLIVNITLAQHNHQHMQDTIKKEEHDQTAHNEHQMPPMSHSFSLNLPMSRNGSGTGWLPDSTPMYGYMIHGKKWMYMIHGNVFLRYTKSDIIDAGSRGSEKFDAINWFMGMGQRRVGRNGLFRFSTMMSLDNLFGGNGYPLLFQTGETWQGKPLVDRQHPHDLFSELSVGYTQAFNKNLDLFLYLGYPGEPALGSVAFMHRVSALYGPDAPLSHHWNDGTHITFGVLTAGARYKKFKLDVSNFTGREPNENRYNFDMPRFDSYSARLSFNPNPYWAFQVSQGFVKSPESIKPEENVYRTTASAVYSKPLSKTKFLNVTGLWGLNQSHSNENAAVLESAFVVKRFSVFGRYEYVEKSIDELNLDDTQFEHDALFGINALSVGLSYDVVNSKALRMALGGQGTYYSADSRLNSLYGKNPLSGQLFLRIYPPRMKIRM
ncbi:MAG TPA: hypothetical protein VGF30_05145 [Bacteroidia bacterium]